MTKADRTLVPESTSAVVNYLINHDEIKPWVCGEMVGTLDATPLIADRDNYFFTDTHGGCGLLNLGQGRYDLHSFVLPSGRGRWVKDNFERVKAWMFENTDCREIITMVPKNNRLALGAARFCGFKKYGSMEKAWKFGGEVFDIDLYVLYKGVA